MSRIEQSSTFLDRLLGDAVAGRLVPAAFQRPYAWGKADVEALWESLMRGFPVGAFLTWTPPRDVDLSAVGRARLGPVLSTASDRPGIILDGQNRLASFAWSVLVPARSCMGESQEAVVDELHAVSPLSEQERAAWLSGEFLAVDPDERSVRFRPIAEAEERLLVPAGVVASSSALNRFVRKWWTANGPIENEHMDWLDRHVSRRVSEARVTVTNLDGLSPADALDAFRHIARAGVPMSDADFEAAMAFALPATPPPVP